MSYAARREAIRNRSAADKKYIRLLLNALHKRKEEIKQLRKAKGYSDVAYRIERTELKTINWIIGLMQPIEEKEYFHNGFKYNAEELVLVCLREAILRKKDYLERKLKVKNND